MKLYIVHDLRDACTQEGITTGDSWAWCFIRSHELESITKTLWHLLDRQTRLYEPATAS